MRALLAGFLAIGLGACAPQGTRSLVGVAPPCNAQSVHSAPGKTWWAEQRWRYADDAAAEAAYATLFDKTPAWPDWFAPVHGNLAVGTRLQMAMGPGQPETKPGGFATFDNIFNAVDVRQYLAVRETWKPKIDRVVTYEVTQTLPVEVGPVGPQVDPDLCMVLPGRWSQAKMLVPDGERMDYLKVIEVRAIR